MVTVAAYDVHVFFWGLCLS